MEEVRIVPRLAEILTAMVELVDDRLRRDYGYACRRGDPPFSCFASVGARTKDTDRELAIDQFTRRFLLPAAVAMANSMAANALSVKATRSYTSPWHPADVLPVAELVENKIALVLGLALRNPDQGGITEYVFSTGYRPA